MSMLQQITQGTRADSDCSGLQGQIALLLRNNREAGVVLSPRHERNGKLGKCVLLYIAAQGFFYSWGMRWQLLSPADSMLRKTLRQGSLSATQLDTGSAFSMLIMSDVMSCCIPYYHYKY